METTIIHTRTDLNILARDCEDAGKLNYFVYIDGDRKLAVFIV